MLDKNFAILGPNDDEGIPHHWNRSTWQWVEGDGVIPETLYTGAEVFDFYRRGELPVGCHTIIGVNTGAQWNVTPTTGGTPQES